MQLVDEGARTTAPNRDDRIRLLKMVTNYGSGGTEGQVHNLVRMIDRTRFDVRFGCLQRWGFFLEELESWKIPISEFPINSLYKPNTFLQQMKLAAYMRSERISIMHSYNFYANVLAIPAARLAGVPVVLASVRDRGVYLTAAQKHLQKFVCSFADKILVNADAVREWLLDEGYPQEKIVVIKNGINLSLYDKHGSHPDVRTDLGIPPDAPIVVMIARLDPQKGFDDFLKAAAILKPDLPNVRFLVVGETLLHKKGTIARDSIYHNELYRLCCDLGIEDRVIFTGHRSDVPALLAEASVSVLPSHSEGLSNSLLESMAAGVPIVATQAGGNSELVRDGVNGLLVPPLAPVQLAQAIKRVLDDPAMARRFGTTSRQIAEENFSMERMVQDTQDLYIAELGVSTRAHRKTKLKSQTQ